MDTRGEAAAPAGLAGPGERPRAGSRHVRRLSAVVGIFLLMLAAYGFALLRLNVSFEPNEQDFGVPMSAARAWIYMQVVAVDAVNDTVQVRISVLPPKSAHDAPRTVADRDMTVVVYHESSADQIRVHAQQAFPEVSMSFDLQSGSIRYYPLDLFATTIHFASFEGAGEGDAHSEIPVHVTTWEGVLGYAIHVNEHARTEGGGHMELQFTIERTGAVVLFGLASYFAMVVLALCAFTIGALVVCKIRKVEVTLFGGVGAIVFALPALRNSLPGAPPLGVWADVLVFFWTELAAVFALCMLVIAWARGGARP